MNPTEINWGPLQMDLADLDDPDMEPLAGMLAEWSEAPGPPSVAQWVEQVWAVVDALKERPDLASLAKTAFECITLRGTWNYADRPSMELYLAMGELAGMSQHGGVERNWAKHSYVCLLHAKFQAKDPHCNELPQRVLAAELPFHLKWQFLDSGYQRWAWLEPSNVPWVADALRDKSYAEATVALPLLKTNSEESMLFNRRLLALYFPELMPLLNGMGADDLFVASLVDARPFRKLEEWMGTMDTNMNTTPKALSLPTMQEMSP